MRPTSRGWIILGVALLLYFFASQTQVGWLYVMAALLAGAWGSTWRMPGRMLRGLTLQRRLNGRLNPDEVEIHAGQTVTVSLRLQNAARAAALQVRGLEPCPLAPAAEREHPFFAASVPAHGQTDLSYTVTCTRRGWYEFPPIQLSTRAPFGFWQARRTAAVPTGVLVFPEYRELKQLALFERAPAPQNLIARSGLGSEFIGVREYRPGDSLRHIHWRTTARAGRLIVKEFAEETLPGLTLALDLRAASVIGAEDNNTLELAIKAAASLAHYASQRGLTVTLATNSVQWPAPAGPVNWWQTMHYLARVQADAAGPFARCLEDLRGAPFVAALFPAPDFEALPALLELHHTGTAVLVVIIDSTAFRLNGYSKTHTAQALAEQLRAAGLDARVIGNEPKWEETLAE